MMCRSGWCDIIIIWQIFNGWILDGWGMKKCFMVYWFFFNIKGWDTYTLLYSVALRSGWIEYINLLP